MKQRAVIGIEISSAEVRGACVRAVGGSPQLAAVASVPTPPGSVDAEGMLSAHEIGDAIRRVCAQLDPRVNQIVVGMTGCNLVARVMEIPPVPDNEIRSVLRGEMDHYRILPAGQSAFDFYRLPNLPDKEPAREPAGEEEPEGVARVLLMGAEERLVASYRSVVDASHLSLVAVEPGSIAIVRALYPMLQRERSVATVIVSAAGTDIFITQEGMLQFYRRVDTGVPELRVQAGQSQQTHAANAGNSPQRGGLLVPDEEEEPAPQIGGSGGAGGADAGSAPAAAVEPYNRQAVSLLMTEVQRSLDYFAREFPLGEDAMRVRFAIDAPDATDLFAVMGQYLRSEAEMASPLDGLHVSPDAAREMSGGQGFRYTAAVGLALRGAGGIYATAPALDLGVGDVVIVERRMAPKVMLASMLASAAVLAGTITAAIIVGNQIARLDRNLTQDKKALQWLTAEHAAKVAMLERQKNLVDTIHSKDKPIREAIEFVSAATARGACLTTLSIDPNGSIHLSGEAASSQVVADMMDTINMSPALEPIRLNNIMRIQPDQGGNTFRFDMQTALLNNIRLASDTTTAPAPQGGQGAAPNAPGMPKPGQSAKGGT